MNRSEFLHKFSLLCVSCSDFVQRQMKGNVPASVMFRRPVALLSTSNVTSIGFDKFIDLHCHPSLKFFLWRKKIWKRHPSRKGSNIFNMQVDVNKVMRGSISGFLVAHYLPEKGLVSESKKAKIIFPILKFFIPSLGDKIEVGTVDNFVQIMKMLDGFERQVVIANNKLGLENNGKDIIRIARSYQEFEDNINAGIISVAQTIEGAHALGRGTNPDSPVDYLTNLEILFERGICLITLAHFFPNDLCSPVEGMPPYSKAGIGYKFKYNPETGNKLLSPKGKSVVIKMLEIGMIVDVTHLPPAARMEVFSINRKFNRPIVFSHTGVQHFFNGPIEYDYFKYYCASDDDINCIRDCNGVIGLIFMTYFLTGVDEHIAHGDKEKMGNAIDHLIETIEYIRMKTDSYEHIALGTDFDNFANSPSDLRDASYFQSLLNRIKNIPGITEEEVSKITHGNALRVLRDGWKR